jgi:hypothetical protein
MHGMGLLIGGACAAVTLITFAALLYSTATAPRSGAVPRHGPLTEVLWALIPVLIMIGAVAPSVRALKLHAANNATVMYKCEMKVGS